ncbi:MAG: hypothetical protein HRT47_09000 [Candidatus Caenarcaniphilales bacterium]|nr:hypothetical protein [Candidatus Caenarcaniphilales bacterium]
MQVFVNKRPGFQKLKIAIDEIKKKFDPKQDYKAIQEYSLASVGYYPEAYIQELQSLGIFDDTLVKFSDEFIQELKDLNQNSKS